MQIQVNSVNNDHSDHDQFQPDVRRSSNPEEILKEFFEDEECRTSLHEKHIFIKVFLGKVFLEGYRIFRKLQNLNVIIFYKKVGLKTLYNFVYFMNLPILDKWRQSVEESVKTIEKMKQKPLNAYFVCFVVVRCLKTVKFHKEAYQNFCTSADKEQEINRLLESKSFLMGENSPTTSFPCLQDYTPHDQIQKSNAKILFESHNEFKDLRQLLALYVDTFANRQKASYIYKETEKSTISFSLQMILNTFNYIIYEETKNQPYSQIESAYWTYFKQQSMTLEQDKKHIVLSGSGQICILEMFFSMEEDEFNSRQGQGYQDIVRECAKFYKKSKVKKYRITNKQWNGEIKQISLEDDFSEESWHGSKAIIYKLETIVINDQIF